MTKRAFNAKRNRVIEMLELVHFDVCESESMNTQARGGYECFITFIDDYSCMVIYT